MSTLANLRPYLTRSIGAIVAVLMFMTAPAGAQSPWTGDWVGWIYLDEGGDLPVRLHLVHGEKETTATIDLPHAKSFRQPSAYVEIEDDRLRFTFKGRSRIDFDGRRTLDTVEGQCRLNLKVNGFFQLHRSPFPLPTIDPKTHAACVGHYRLEPDRLLVVSSRPWGELICHDTKTGFRGTFFPIADDRFFLGSAMYVPAPVSMLLALTKSQDGEVDGLLVQEPGQSVRRARRTVIVEERFSFKTDGTTLTGTLHLPPGPGPHPGVVILGGSGWERRTSSTGEARLWAAAGFVALAYDKRGYGESQGKTIVPFLRTASDAAAAVQAVGADPRVDAAAVGLTGRSRGGWFAPLAATVSDKAAFVVLMVAPAITPARQETTRRLNLVRQEGFDETQVADARAYLDAMFRYIRSDEHREAHASALKKVKDESWLPLVEPIEPDTDPADLQWARLNMHHDPRPRLERLRTPVLALFGALDRNVVPAENIPILRKALAKAGNVDSQIIVVPKVGHSLREGGRLHRLRGYPAGFWARIFSWARSKRP